MTQILPPPIREKMYLDTGALSKAWLRYFQNVQTELQDASDANTLNEAFTVATGSSIVLTNLNYYVICNSSTGMNVYFPPLADITRKLAFVIVNIGIGTATIIPNGAELIYDETTLPLYQYDSVQILNASTYWGII